MRANKRAMRPLLPLSPSSFPPSLFSSFEATVPRPPPSSPPLDYLLTLDESWERPVGASNNGNVARSAVRYIQLEQNEIPALA